ncbi:hypothetical protein [Azospirillum sp. sgz301742]
MLHIKDIEAFARINESLFRASGTAAHGEGDADLSNHPAVLLARLMAAAQASAEGPAKAEAAQPGAEDGAKSVEAAEGEQATEPAAPTTMAGLFSRMMFGQR